MYDGRETAKCPYCGSACDADWVDVGVGYVQCGPYNCACGAFQIGPHDDNDHKLTEREKETGWYEPGTLPSISSGNVIGERFVSHQVAKAEYVSNYPMSATAEGRENLRTKGSIR